MYLDFSKAFDKVCHVKLIQKLKSYNIGGKLLKWLENFLSERYQQVIVQGISSESGKVISGVPQGTVLGPILFILYINDITEVIRNASVMIFADDSKLIKDTARQPLTNHLHVCCKQFLFKKKNETYAIWQPCYKNLAIL